MRTPWIALVLGLACTSCESFADLAPAEAAPVGEASRSARTDGHRYSGIVSHESAATQTGREGILTELPGVGFFSSGQADRTPELQSDLQGATEGRKVVYSGAIRVEVARVEDAMSRVRAQIEAAGGYLEQRDGGELTFRVPAERFEPMLAFARTLGRVLDEAQQAEDVTDQWRDLSIRLDNARRSRERLLALLDRAEAVEDVLKIEKELQRLTTEIETMEAQLKKLEDHVAMATLKIVLVSTAAPQPVDVRTRPSRFDWINQVGADHAIRAF